jgi:hypothetical protein
MAHRRAVAHVLRQPDVAKTFRQRLVLRIGAHFGNDVDIIRGANGRGGSIGDQQACSAATEEHQFVEQRPQEPSGCFEQKAIRVRHGEADASFR